MDHTTLHPARLTLWLTLIALVAALVAGPAGVALAQGGDEVYCNGLSEADCTLLQEARAANTTRAAVALPAFDFSMAINAEGETINGQLAGNGALVMAPALLDVMAQMPDMSQGMMTDMTGLLDMLDALDETLIESMLTDSAGYVQLSSLELNTPDTAVSMVGDMVLRDSVLYLHLNAPNGADAWFGQEITLTSTDMADMSQSIEELRTQIESEEFQTAMAQMSEYQSKMTALSDLMTKHVTTARGEDATLHDQAMAVFTTTFDLKGLLADPELSTAVYDLLTAPGFGEMLNEGGEMDELTPAQVQLTMTMVGMMIADPVITSEQWVGLDDGLLHKTDSAVALTLDTTVFGTSEGSPTEPITMAMDMVMEMDDIATVDVAGFPVSREYYTFDKASQFMPGTPDMVDRIMELGDAFNGAIVGSETDVYAFEAASGEQADIELEADEYVTLSLYGPDGFLIDTIEEYGGGTISSEFTVDGMYLAVIKADMIERTNYTLTLRVP